MKRQTCGGTRIWMVFDDMDLNTHLAKAGQRRAIGGGNPNKAVAEILPGLPVCYTQQSETTQDFLPSAARAQTLPRKLGLPDGLW